MRPRLFWHFATLFLLSTASVLKGEGWGQLKLGMTSDEAFNALGNPLIRTAGNGFELWIYDNNAEVVFYGGPLVAWTTPKMGKIAGKPTDVWQPRPDGANSPIFILPRSVTLKSKRPDLPSNDAGSVYRVPLYQLRN